MWISLGIHYVFRTYHFPKGIFAAQERRSATLLGPIRVNMHPIIEVELSTKCFKRVPASHAALCVTFVQVVRAVERHLDSCLGIGVLGLQHFDGFS